MEVAFRNCAEDMIAELTRKDILKMKNTKNDFEMVPITLLDEEIGNPIVVTYGLGETLLLFRARTWTQFEKMLQALSPVEVRATLARQFFSSAYDFEVDGEKRIWIPKFFVEKIGGGINETMDGNITVFSSTDYLKCHPEISEKGRKLISFADYVLAKKEDR